MPKPSKGKKPSTTTTRSVGGKPDAQARKEKIQRDKARSKPGR